LKERCGLEPRTNFFFRLRNRQKLVRIRFGCGLVSRIYGTFYVKLLCCVLRPQLIGLFIFKNHLTGDICLQFLCKEVPRIRRGNFTSKIGPLIAKQSSTPQYLTAQ